MRIQPDIEEFRKLAGKGNLIPVYAEMMADLETPVSTFVKLRQDRPAFLFESIEGGERISRYSFVGCKPIKIFIAGESHTRIIERDGSSREIQTPQDPLNLIEAEMQRYQPVSLPGMPPLSGGAVGFLGHEYVHRVETSVPTATEDILGAPLMYFAVMDSVVVFDHARQVMRLCSNAHIEADEDPQKAYQRACDEIHWLAEKLQTEQPMTPSPLPANEQPISVPNGNFKRPDFEAAVEHVREYIRAGDVIQVVLSQRFEDDFKHDPLDLYRALRIVNPSPYMFILESADFAVVGASPEVHVRATHRRVEIRPIAGTRPRGADSAEDLAYEKDLLADPKERAEHLMLVDLARNDIGRVCETGSVEVKEYAVVERYSHVMHIVSQVEGKLGEDKTAYDLMRATFPAGTLSGAPKIRALQIISDMEKQKRGIYGGALGYFSYDGNLDSCIAIRTAFLKNDRIFIQSGAGVVADSIPSAEYEETINKAKGMLKAVSLAASINTRQRTPADGATADT